MAFLFPTIEPYPKFEAPSPDQPTETLHNAMLLHSCECDRVFARNIAEIKRAQSNQMLTGLGITSAVFIIGLVVLSIFG